MIAATALIAEDEPLLAASLRDELERLWPDLRIVADVRNGIAAVEEALARRPQLLFLDIRMPGMSGLESAQAIAEDWPDDALAPLIVFVTAYDQYAIEAFNHAAVDYLLKPVDPARLAQTCRRAEAALRARLETRPETGARGWDDVLGSLRQLLVQPRTAGRAEADALPELQVIQAAAGSAIRMVPVGDVIYFEAADKYVRVITAEREHLIRTALRDLVPRLDPARFWQIHRGTVVRADAIDTALRDEAGKVTLVLRGRPERLQVSRLYSNRFKPM